MQAKDTEGATYSGAAWYHPKESRFYGGRIGTYQGGILTDVAQIESKVVLQEVLGLMRPDYTLEQAVTIQSTPELVLDVDTEAVTAGHADVKPLESSVIRDKTFSTKHFECILNEAKIVIEDRAGMKASHDIMALNSADCAREVAKMRNDDIAAAFIGQADVAGLDWDDTDDRTDDPMLDINHAIADIKCAGYPVDFVALNPIDWGYFLGHRQTHSMVQAGIFKLTDSPTVTVPGYPTVKILIDCAITEDHCIVGSKRATILAQGPTESVKVRDEFKRYTAFIIRDYEQAQVVVPTAIRDITPITA